MTKISMIAALDNDLTIGKNGTLPWYIKSDFAWFVKNTKNKIVVMGRKNYEDILKFTKGKPLKDRINVVLSSQKNLSHEGFLFFNSVEDILNHFKNEELMIIGGSYIYKEFLPYASRLILTEIKKDFNGDCFFDCFFPTWDKLKFKESYRESNFENDLNFDFVIYDLIDIN